MAIGLCRYMVCQSTLATDFRGTMHIVEPLADSGYRLVRVETTVCSEHERQLETAHKKKDRIFVTAEGWLYLESWVVSPLFTAW
jgi:hypothetical protein